MAFSSQLRLRLRLFQITAVTVILRLRLWAHMARQKLGFTSNFMDQNFNLVFFQFRFYLLKWKHPLHSLEKCFHAFPYAKFPETNTCALGVPGTALFFDNPERLKHPLCAQNNWIFNYGIFAQLRLRLLYHNRNCGYFSINRTSLSKTWHFLLQAMLWTTCSQVSGGKLFTGMRETSSRKQSHSFFSGTPCIAARKREVELAR